MWTAARNCALRWSSRGRSSMKCLAKPWHKQGKARQGKARQGKAKQSKAKPCLALPCLVLPCFALPCLALPCPHPPPSGRKSPHPPLGGWGSPPPFWGEGRGPFPMGRVRGGASRVAGLTSGKSSSYAWALSGTRCHDLRASACE